jgi:hypothetical protein
MINKFAASRINADNCKENLTIRLLGERIGGMAGGMVFWVINFCIFEI